MLVFLLTSLFESEWEVVFDDEIPEGELNNSLVFNMGYLCNADFPSIS